MPTETVVVFDSSVVIPLIVPASRSTRLFRRLRAAGFRVVLSPFIVGEVEQKMRHKVGLRDWLDLSDEEIEGFLNDLPRYFDIVPGKRQAHGAVPADPKDDKIIAAALESNASYIISEDKHLLDLDDYQGIKIMNRQGFEKELDRLEVAEVE